MTAGVLPRLRLPEPAVIFAFLAGLWAAASGLVLLLLVTWRLSAPEQGYYFTFASLLLLQQFLELGFGIVLTQFVSHEWVALHRGADGRVTGDAAALARLGSLVRLGLGWYGVVALLYFGVVGGAGQLFFSLTGADHVRWVGAWWALTAMAALAVITVPLSSLIEGSGGVARNQSIRLLASVGGSIVAAAALIGGAGLYALALLFGVRVLIALPQLAFAARPLLRLAGVRGDGVSWRREFWPQQWRISVSWAAGFVMFQSLTPLLFWLRGPVAAGQLGATLQLFNAVNRLSSAWLVAVQPRMGHLGALGRLGDLRRLVVRTTARSLATAAVLSLLILAALGLGNAVGLASIDRFASPGASALFLLTATALQVGNVTTTAVRFQKREPFVVTALIGAGGVAVSAVLLGDRFGVNGAAVGFAATILAVVLPWTLRIYLRELADGGLVRRRSDVRPSASPAVVAE